MNLQNQYYSIKMSDDELQKLLIALLYTAENIELDKVDLFDDLILSICDILNIDSNTTYGELIDEVMGIAESV